MQDASNDGYDQGYADGSEDAFGATNLDALFDEEYVPRAPVVEGEEVPTRVVTSPEAN
jgi:hypothetical protein